jgi:hypothetical protein
MNSNPYEFEKFPHGQLPVRLTRRQFFSGLMDEVKAFSQTVEHPCYRLSDLGNLPDQELAFLIPVPLPEVAFVTREGYIWGKPAPARSFLRLFPENCPASFVIRQFNAGMCIVDAARNLARETGLDKQWAFAYVRGVFLWLVLARLYVPLNQRGATLK